MIPQDFYRDTYVPYLTGEGRAVAVRFPACWACLFRREPLQHCAVAEFVAPYQREQSRPLDGAFTREVTIFAGSARWRLDIYKYHGVSQPLLLPPSAIVLALAPLAIFTRARTHEHIAVDPPSFIPQDAGEARCC